MRIDSFSELLIWQLCVNGYLAITSLTLFYFRNHNLILKRNVGLILISSVCSIITCGFAIASFGPLSSYEVTSCWLECLTLSLFAPLTIYIYLLRVNHLIYLNCMQNSRLLESKLKNSVAYKTLPIIEKFSFKFFQLLGRFSSLGKKRMSSLSEFSSGQLEQMHGKTLLLALFPCIFISLTLFTVTASVYPIEMKLKGTCPSSIYNPQLLFIVFLLFIWFCSLFQMHRIKNGMGIKTEYTFGAILCLIPYTLLVIAQVQGLDDGQGLGTRYGVSVYIVMMGLFSQTVFITFPLIYILITRNTMKALEEDLIVDSNSLEIVINTPHLFIQFKQALASEFCIENGLFIEEYKAMLQKDQEVVTGINGHAIENTKTNQKRRNKTAMVDLFTKYITPNSPFQLNLSESTVKSVQERLEAGSDSLEDLKIVYDEVIYGLYNTSFTRFVNARKDKFKNKELLNGKALGAVESVAHNLVTQSMRSLRNENKEEQKSTFASFSLKILASAIGTRADK